MKYEPKVIIPMGLTVFVFVAFILIIHNETHPNELSLCVLCDDVEEHLTENTTSRENTCGKDTEFINGVCQVVKVETTGSDAPFFGIFVYVENLISWIFGTNE